MLALQGDPGSDLLLTVRFQLSDQLMEMLLLGLRRVNLSSKDAQAVLQVVQDAHGPGAGAVPAVL